jgi:hypothetical protein
MSCALLSPLFLMDEMGVLARADRRWRLVRYLGRSGRAWQVRSERSAVRRGVDLFQCSRVASYEVLGGCRMAQGREIEEGSRVALHGDSSSRGARRRGYSPPPACARRCSLALGSRTAALRRAVAWLFWPRATACKGPTEGEVTASAKGATAGFCGQMHGRLGARLVGRTSVAAAGRERCS